MAKNNATKTTPIWCYEIDTLHRRREEYLTFRDAVSVLYQTINHDYILMRVTKDNFPYTCPIELVDVLDVRAVYSRPKKELNLYTKGDIMIDRQYIRYKMYFTDLSGKLVKSGMRKILLKDLTVGKFWQFLCEQSWNSAGFVKD
jgi:hypothetical protein